MKRHLLIDITCYLTAFLLIQTGVYIASTLLCKALSLPQSATLTVAASTLSSLLTIVVFAWRKWASVRGGITGGTLLLAMLWAALLALGCTHPMTWLLETCHLEMPAALQQQFTAIMQHDLGYVCIGLLVPIAEELVFRGAILRRLLDTMGHGKRWIAIAVTALLFGIVHGNMAQGVNATLTGLLLGWMYVRTGSLLPCMAFHWTNNTIAYLAFRLMPSASDMSLNDLYGGDSRRVGLAILFSLMIAVGAAYQIHAITAHKGTADHGKSES